jgi:hypothetical protein
MSYEGYKIQFCAHGHEMQLDEHILFEDNVCFCGEHAEHEYIDCVDLTNGCDVLPDGSHDPNCYAHRHINTILGYTKKKCKYCNDNGFVITAILYKNEICNICDGKNKACSTCFGTGIIRIPFERNMIHCPHCKGTGFEYVPIYDISSLINNSIDRLKSVIKFTKTQLELNSLEAVKKLKEKLMISEEEYKTHPFGFPSEEECVIVTEKATQNLKLLETNLKMKEEHLNFLNGYKTN